MIKKLFRKLASGSLQMRSGYHFHNEVPKFDPAKDYYKILEVNKTSSDA